MSRALCASLSARSARRKKRGRPMALSLGGGTQNAADTAHQTLPSGSLDVELLPSGGRQAVVTGLPVVFGCALKGRDPPAVFEPVERRVQRAMLYLQDI